MDLNEQQCLETGTPDLFSVEDPEDRRAFVRCVVGYYLHGKRPMPWRDEITPYRVVVSEMMLQQTQVPRVLEKFPEFVARFPDFSTLSKASLAEVLGAWQGLGYNRRAKYLHTLAGTVMEKWDGMLPRDYADLITLPGIGAATAGSIAAFAYNAPVVFIETNIRRVFIHHFFPVGCVVSDSDILPLIEMTLDQDNPRDWYYALMDYGTWLARRIQNPNRRSKHYTRQSRFEGSDRQIRGAILRHLITEKMSPPDIIIDAIGADQARVAKIIMKMIQEGLVSESAGVIRIAEKKE